MHLKVHLKEKFVRSGSRSFMKNKYEKGEQHYLKKEKMLDIH
jgi:hypothetical protein